MDLKLIRNICKTLCKEDSMDDSDIKLLKSKLHKGDYIIFLELYDYSEQEKKVGSINPGEVYVVKDMSDDAFLVAELISKYSSVITGKIKKFTYDKLNEADRQAGIALTRQVN